MPRALDASFLDLGFDRFVHDRRMVVPASFLLLVLMTSSSIAQEAVFRTHIGPSLLAFGSPDSQPGEEANETEDNGSAGGGENPGSLFIEMPLTQLAGRAPAAVNVDVVLSGGEGEYTFQGDLMELAYTQTEPRKGVISGQLNETRQYTLTATDGAGTSTSKSILLEVYPPLLAYLSSAPAPVRPGELINVMPQVSGQVGASISWEALEGRGLHVDGQTGAITGVAGAPGSLFDIRVVAQDSADGATDEIAFDIPVIADPIFISVADSVWRAGRPVAIPVQASGGYGAISLDATLPSGLSLSGDAIVGTLTGHSWQQVVHQISIAGTDGYGSQSGSDTASITVNPAMSLVGTPATNVTVDTAYSYTPMAFGALGMITFSYSGTLPPGFSFNTATGSLSGTPNQPGTYPRISISFTDSEDGATFQGEPFTIVVEAGQEAPIL